MFFHLMYLEDVLYSIKEINRLIISKGMSSISYWEKLTFSKLQFSWKENLKKCTSFEEQKSIQCYLVIGCFDWKSGVFQRIVVRVYYNEKIWLSLNILRFIYFAIFDSYLSYRCLVWAQNCSTIQQIEILQKSC